MEVVRYGRTYRVSHSCGRGRPEFAFRRRLRRAFQHLLQLAGLAALGAVLMLLTGCAAQSSAAPSGGGGRQSFTVNMTQANRFEPAELTVPKGSTVTWINTSQVVHTVTDDPSKAINKSDAVLPGGAQPFDSGSISAGASSSHTFDVPGRYTYFCIPHESLGMVGHITVTD